MATYMTDQEFEEFASTITKYFVSVTPETNQEFDFVLGRKIYHIVLKWNAFTNSTLQTPYNSSELEDKAGTSVFAQTVQFLNTAYPATYPPGTWIMDIYDFERNPIVTSVSIVAGINLLEQFKHEEIGFGLIATGESAIEPPIENPSWDGNGYIFFVASEDLDTIANIVIVDETES